MHHVSFVTFSDILLKMLMHDLIYFSGDSHCIFGTTTTSNTQQHSIQMGINTHTYAHTIDETLSIIKHM